MQQKLHSLHIKLNEEWLQKLSKRRGLYDFVPKLEENKLWSQSRLFSTDSHKP